MGGGLDAGDVQRLHVGRMVEHGRQLRGEFGEFVVAEAQAGQPGYVGGLVSADSTGHSGNIAGGLPGLGGTVRHEQVHLGPHLQFVDALLHVEADHQSGRHDGVVDERL